MYTYRKQVTPNPGTPGSTSNYIIYSLDISGLAVYRIADVEIDAMLCDSGNPSTSKIYYRKIQIVDNALSPSSTIFTNPSYTYQENITTRLFLSGIDYIQSTSTLRVKTTNPTGASRNGTCSVTFKINFY